MHLPLHGRLISQSSKRTLPPLFPTVNRNLVCWMQDQGLEDLEIVCCRNVWDVKDDEQKTAEKRVYIVYSIHGGARKGKLTSLSMETINMFSFLFFFPFLHFLFFLCFLYFLPYFLSFLFSSFSLVFT